MTRLLTAIEIVGRMDSITLAQLRAMQEATKEARTDAEYIVRASEWFDEAAPRARSLQPGESTVNATSQYVTTCECGEPVKTAEPETTCKKCGRIIVIQWQWQGEIQNDPAR
jgi:hypothetical protein